MTPELWAQMPTLPRAQGTDSLLAPHAAIAQVPGVAAHLAECRGVPPLTRFRSGALAVAGVTLPSHALVAGGTEIGQCLATLSHEVLPAELVAG